MLKNINVRLFEQEQQIVLKMRELGLPVNEIIRNCIRNYAHEYLKEEKGYSEALKIRAALALEKHNLQKKLDSMTDEEYATKELRAVVKGDRAYITMFNTGTYGLPLNGIKELRVDDQMIKIHLGILDDINVENREGVKMTESEKREARENLNKIRRGE